VCARCSKRTRYAPRPADFAPAPPGTEVRRAANACGFAVHARKNKPALHLCAFTRRATHSVSRCPPLQARQAWVEEFQPAFSALRSVRTAPALRVLLSLLLTLACDVHAGAAALD
jgi:hypothetical protein